MTVEVHPCQEVRVDTQELEIWLNNDPPKQKTITDMFEIPLSKRESIFQEKIEKGKKGGKRQTWLLVISVYMRIHVYLLGIHRYSSLDL